MSRIQPRASANLSPSFTPTKCKCNRCFKTFETKGALIRHLPSCVKLSHAPVPTTCNNCSQHFEAKSALFRHLPNCVKLPQFLPTPSACRRCHSLFPSKAALLRHLDECRLIPLAPRLPRAKKTPPPPHPIKVGNATWPSRSAHKKWLAAQPALPKSKPKTPSTPPLAIRKGCKRCGIEHPSLTAYRKHVKAGCAPPPTPPRPRGVITKPISSACTQCKKFFPSRRKKKAHVCKPPPVPGFRAPVDDTVLRQKSSSTPLPAPTPPLVPPLSSHTSIEERIRQVTSGMPRNPSFPNRRQPPPAQQVASGSAESPDSVAARTRQILAGGPHGSRNPTPQPQRPPPSQPLYAVVAGSMTSLSFREPGCEPITYSQAGSGRFLCPLCRKTFRRGKLQHHCFSHPA
jgi:hypothetical protein